MIKKTIKFNDFNGVERTEDFYFNFMESEVIEMETGVTGGLTTMLRQIMSTMDVPQLMSQFKELVLRAYGVKSADGKQFIKTDEVKDAFRQSNAYSKIFMELATNATAASAFVNGIIPKDMPEFPKQTDVTLPAMPPDPVADNTPTF